MRIRSRRCLAVSLMGSALWTVGCGSDEGPNVAGAEAAGGVVIAGRPTKRIGHLGKIVAGVAKTDAAYSIRNKSQPACSVAERQCPTVPVGHLHEFVAGITQRVLISLTVCDDGCYGAMRALSISFVNVRSGRSCHRSDMTNAVVRTRICVLP